MGDLREDVGWADVHLLRVARILLTFCDYAKLPEVKCRGIWVRAVVRPNRIAAVVFL